MYRGDRKLAPAGTLGTITANLNVTEAKDNLLSSIGSASPEPPTDFQYGINIDAPDFGTLGQQRILELGVTSVRVAYNGGNYGSKVAWCRDRGLHVNFHLGYEEQCPLPTSVAGRVCYANRAATVVQDLGANNIIYHTWNEWNHGYHLGCGHNTPPCNDYAMYTDLLCRTYNAMKNVNSNALLAGGVIAGANRDFVIGMMDNGAGECMDFLDLHLYVYRQTLPGHVAEDAPGSVGCDKLLEVINDRNDLVIASHGSSIPIVSTETGFHHDGSTAARLRGADFITEIYSRVPTAAPFCKGLWWFTMFEPAKLNNHGLLTGDGAIKPHMFAAYKAVIPN